MRIPAEIMAQCHPDADVAPLTDRLIPARDYRGLNRQEAQLRLWLPDQARQALSEVCDRSGISMTAYLTEYFATYLFGIHELLKMREFKQGLYEPRPVRKGCAMGVPREEEDPEVLNAALDDPVPEMGKNIFALKIFVPSMVKDGMQLRADKAGVPLGKFARAMICAHLFGRDIGPLGLIRS